MPRPRKVMKNRIEENLFSSFTFHGDKFSPQSTPFFVTFTADEWMDKNESQEQTMDWRMEMGWDCWSETNQMVQETRTQTLPAIPYPSICHLFLGQEWQDTTGNAKSRNHRKRTTRCVCCHDLIHSLCLPCLHVPSNMPLLFLSFSSFTSLTISIPFRCWICCVPVMKRNRIQG